MSNYLANDRKLLLESEEILDTDIPAIIAEKPDFVIVCGDMTKDGEKRDHELVAARLAKLEAAGIRVYVGPGNHDILNYHANRFEGPDMIRVPNVTETEFTNIYADYGYNEAIERDPNSLCYVAEPVEGLWLLCIDSTIHITNELLEESQIGGGFEQAKLDWIEKMLARAVKERKAVFVVEHHGVNPHWNGQQKLHPDYLLKDYEDMSKMFAAYKVRAVFTGHYHSQDISFADWGNNDFLFDIETGSFVTYPCPYRVVTIGSGNRMTVESRFLEAIPSITDGFVDYAREYMESGVRGIAVKKIVAFGAPYAQALSIANMVAEAYAAHYAGDETPQDFASPTRRDLDSKAGSCS
jgi:3',5'-cyclic AMP phosphodiesterase CpdA